MSLNKTLDRFFDEIRREAKRNPEFADRLDAVLRGHASRRDVSDETIDEVLSAPAEPPAEAPAAAKPIVPKAPAKVEAPKPTPQPVAAPKPSLNPVGLYVREGEDALYAALENEGLPSLQALVREHNLDPSGEADSLDRDALALHIIDHAKKRAERDKKLFDY